MRLAPILEGQAVAEFWARSVWGYKPRVGQVVSSVTSVGKHLLVEFDNGLTLQTHLGMNGSWKVYPQKELAPNDKVRFDPYLKIVIATKDGYALCFRAQSVKTFVRGKDILPQEYLGQDLCDEGLDFGEIIRQARKADQFFSVEELLLDQRVASGVGNIYKSEVLHIERIFPFVKVKDLSDSQLKELYSKAAELLKRNTRHARQLRSIAPAGGFFVYERFRKPCLRCETPISRDYRGKYMRSTYWCPACQPLGH